MRQIWDTRLEWLRPGLGVKRWLVLLALGVGMIGLGSALALRVLYPLPGYFYYLTLQFLPRELRALVFLVTGGGILVGGLWGLNRAILAPFVKQTSQPITTVLYNYRRRGRGPKIVAVGGGHGQATLLRGLKNYTSNLTAIVTVADDGGSSGRLRRELGMLPPGDFRNCIAALADDESLVTRLMQYRFANGNGLQGHSFGNLFISAMAEVTGSFETALQESSKVLAVQGQVLPSTLETLTLCADIQQDQGTPVRVQGESEIPKVAGRILRVSLEPEAPRAYPNTIRAILDADLIVIGPGSLYTSILPNLLVPEIVAALRSARAPKIYVCNVASQPGETDGFSARAHVKVLEQHIGTGVLSAVMVNNRRPRKALAGGSTWVAPDLNMGDPWRVVATDLLDASMSWRHDSRKLADALMELI